MKLNLKTQNYPLIGIYIIVNVSIFLTLYNNGNISIATITLYFNELKIKDGIFFTVLSLFIIIIGGMFSNKYKEILVFWKLENRLPGCEAFSKYINEDSRIDLKKIKNKYGKLPKNPTKQNSLWYSIFKSLNDKSITKTHKDFLLCRELSVITIVLFILSIPIYIEYSIVGLYFLVFLILEYIVVRYCAKNTAERLVVNTLALSTIDD